MTNIAIVGFNGSVSAVQVERIEELCNIMGDNFMSITLLEDGLNLKWNSEVIDQDGVKEEVNNILNNVALPVSFVSATTEVVTDNSELIEMILAEGLDGDDIMNLTDNISIEAVMYSDRDHTFDIYEYPQPWCCEKE